MKSNPCVNNSNFTSICFSCFSVTLTCSCVNIPTMSNGYGECPCATNEIIDIQAGSVGAIVLQYGNAGDFEYANV